MLQAFTRNYQDNSTDAGFQFEFYCDHCKDGYKSTFIESDTYKKRGFLRNATQGANILGSLVGGRVSRLGYAAQRGGDIFSQRFEGKSPEWQKEHEQAFERCQHEVKQHFHRCPSCSKYVCDHCWNEDEGLCVSCAPRQEVLVARTRADAMKRNISQAGESATVWQGVVESKTTICPACGKPAGTGAFCNNCGQSMALVACPKCGTANQHTVRFCSNCGTNMAQKGAPDGKCRSCGWDNPPATKFCGGCGEQLE